MKRLLSLIVALGALAAPAIAQENPALDVRFGTVAHAHSTVGVVAAEATDITFGPDVSGSLAGDYFKFFDALNAHCYYLWFKINSVGPDPAVASCTGIEVDGATNDTAATLAGTARTNVAASAANTYIAVTGATTHLILTNRTNGATTDTVDGGGGHPTGFTITKNTDGVSGSVAISPSSVVASVQGWQVCADGVNTGTWLAVGQATDPTTDGIRIAPGVCYACMQCTAGGLKAVKVAGQAAGTGYSVVQFKQ